MALLLAMSCSCSKVTESRNAPTSAGKDNGLTGQEIWESTRATYATCKTYRDQAVLYLGYTLRGQRIQEPQPWSVAWSKPNKLSANWYNAQIQFDGKRVGCFIYDNDTANLDNQWLIIEPTRSTAMTELLGDTLARYFVGGHSEIPLDSTFAAPMPYLVPPIVGWLSHDVSWPIFETPRLIERLDDGLVDNKPCFRLRFHLDDMSSDVWIDQDSKLVRQMTVPVQFLDPAVRSALEVSDIQFFVRMHKATINDEMLSEVFTLSRPRDAIAVQQLVPMPEPFPCELIGKQLPELPLIDAQGNRLDALASGQTVVLVWISGLIGQQSITELNEIAAKSTGKPTRWIAIYSDEHIEPTTNNRRQLAEPLRMWSASHANRLGWCYDSGLNSSHALKLKTMPAAVLVSPDKIVQYAVAVGADHWQEKLAAAVDRVQAGESIGEEMLRDYESYVSRYQRRLQLVSAERALASDGEQNSIPTKELQITPVWQIREIEQPGNIYLDFSAGEMRLLVFEGWQTVAEIDGDGRIAARHQLELPSGVAVNRIRISDRQSASKSIAAFSVFGHGICVSDGEFKSSRWIAAGEKSKDDILDCNWFAGADGSAVRLLAGLKTGGLQIVDLAAGVMQRAGDVSFDSFAIVGNRLWGFEDTNLIAASPQGERMQVNELGSLSMGTILASPLLGDERINFLVSGTTAAGTWEVTGYDADGQPVANSIVGPQLFEEQIEPGGVANTTQWGPVVFWADSLNRVHFFNRKLESIGIVKLPSPVLGVCAFERNGKLILVTSHPDGLFTHAISLPTSPFQGVSTPKK